MKVAEKQQLEEEIRQRIEELGLNPTQVSTHYACNLAIWYLMQPRQIPYSGKFSPGVKFRQFRQSVQAAKF